MRLLLATLLITGQHVVSIDRLVSELWSESPRTARTQVHGYVMRLRRALGDVDGRLLSTVSPGYRIRLDDRDVDVQLFEARAEEGRRALRDGEPERAAECFRTALRLWRGPAMADVPSTALVSAEVQRFTEQRLAVLDARIDADLLCGRHTEVIGELRRQVADDPLREKPWQQLMTALYRSGRRAEALQQFQRVRRILIDEVGTEPSFALRQLHQQLLVGDPGLHDTSPVRATGSRPICQLPPDIPDFTGRADTVEKIVHALTHRGLDGPPPVVVVHGPPGVGKSAFALRVAHLTSSAFPDGQLYLSLSEDSGRPRDTHQMLAEILTSLGVRAAALPEGTPSRAALARSILAGRRVLLVLDDAVTPGQVQPLVPSTGNCAVLITSRRLPTGLAGNRHVDLDVLPPADGQRLLSRIVGWQRAMREPDEVVAIARLCGQLPLAIRIAAARLVGRPAWPLRLLRRKLSTERLAELRFGEVTVRTSFARGLRGLPAEAVHAFRLLGLLTTRTLPSWAVSALLDRPDPDVVLDVLVDANLVQVTGLDLIGQPSYRMTDLLRLYAAEDARAVPLSERREAVTRALAAWRDLAFSVAPQRLATLDDERANLASALDIARAWGLSALAGELAAVIARTPGDGQSAWSLNPV